MAQTPPKPPSLKRKSFELPPLEKGRFFTRLDWVSFWSAFLVTLIAYTSTMQPTVGLEDAGELVVAADYLGVPHPPGYPIWTLLAWFFQWIFHWVKYNGHPNPAWGVAFMSVFFGALACGLIGMLITKSGAHFLQLLDKKDPPDEKAAASRSIFSDWKLPATGFGIGILLLSIMIVPKVGPAFAVILSVCGLGYLFFSWVAHYLQDDEVNGLLTTFAMGSLLYGFICGVLFFLCFWVGHSFSLESGPDALPVNTGLLVALGLLVSIPLFDYLMGQAQRSPRELGSGSRTLLLWAAGLAGALLFAFSPVMWSQSVIPEVYSLNAFFLAIILLLTYYWMCRPNEDRLLYWACFLFGLGLTNHQSLLFLLLFLLIAIGMRRRELFTNATALVMVGVSIFLFFKFSGLGLDRTREGIPAAEASALMVMQILTFIVASCILAAPLIFFIVKKRTIGLWTTLSMFIGHGCLMRIPLVGAQYGAYVPEGKEGLYLGLRIAFGVIGVLFIIAPLIWFQLKQPKRFAIWRKLYIMEGLVLLALSFHLFMAIASEQNPPMNWAYPRTTAGFKHALFRGQYEGIPMTKNLEKTVKQVLNIYPEAIQGDSPQHLKAQAYFDSQRFFFFKQLGAFFYSPENRFSMIWQFSKGLSFLALVPLFLMFRSRWHFRTWMTAGCYAMVSLTVLFIVAQNPLLEIQDLFVKRVQYIQAHALFAIWISYGAILTVYMLHRLYAPVVHGGVAALAVLVVLPGVPLYKNATDAKFLAEIGACEMNGHNFGWYFGYYQLMGAEGIQEELLPDDPPLPNPSYPPKMDPNAIFFGGTDPGRFVPTYMLFSAKVRPDVHLFTQNALADYTYMNIMRDLYGKRVWVPGKADSDRAFVEFRDEYEAGQIRQSGSVGSDRGKFSVQGIENVMRLNAKLSKVMWDRNKDLHSFYIEESYAIPWMYDYLTPHGLVMKLNPEKVGRLPEQLVVDDFEFWEWFIAKLKRHPAFERDIIAQKSFSKLRSSIAGLYATKGDFARAERAYLQSIDLYPPSPESNFRLARLYRDREWYDSAKELIEILLKNDPDNKRAKKFIREMEVSLVIDRERKVAYEAWKEKPADLERALKLIDIYDRLAQRRRMYAIAEAFVRNQRVDATSCLEVYRAFYQYGQYSVAAEILKAAEKRDPGDYRMAMERAIISIKTFRPAEECFAALAQGIKIGGDEARAYARKDPRFEPIKKTAEWYRMVEGLIPKAPPAAPKNFPGLPGVAP